MPEGKVIICLLLATLLLTNLAVAVFARAYNAGVSEGQYVKYGDFTGSGPGVESFNDYDWLRLEVVAVSGKDVTLLSTGQFKNGTATPGNGTMTVWNVETGTEDGVPSTQGPIIAADLNSGDQIPPPNTYAVNDTEDRTYLGAKRSVNILSVSISTPDYNSTLVYVYDKLSGILLESASETTVRGQAGPVTSAYSYVVVETNIFNSSTVPLFPLEFIILFVAIILIVIIALALSLRHPK